MNRQQLIPFVGGLAFGIALTTVPAVAGDGTPPIAHPDLGTVFTERIWVVPSKWQALIAGLLAIVAAVVGFGGIAFATVYNAKKAQERYEQQQEDQRTRDTELRTEEERVLAFSLRAEVSTLKKFLCRRSESAESHIESREVPTSSALGLYLVPGTPIFDARNGDLGLLGAELAGKVATFYSILGEIQSHIEHVRAIYADRVDINEFRTIKNDMDTAITEVAGLTLALDKLSGFDDVLLGQPG